MLTLHIIVVVGIFKNLQFDFLLKTIMSSLQNRKFEKEGVIELKSILLMYPPKISTYPSKERVIAPQSIIVSMFF